MSLRGKRKRAAFFVCLFCLAVFGSVSVRAAENEKVRVGYFEFDGYHRMDAQGRRSGYGYEYLQYLSSYGNFQYEYVGYEKSWDEMQDMLERGEIDLLTSAQMTEERQKRFDFSEYPIGSSASILTVKAGNERYLTDEYPKLDGIRVGLLEGNSRNEGLERFAEENSFTYRPVYYETSAGLADALQEGTEIDAALSSNLRKIKNEWIVATFDTSPFYVMVKKGNSGLLEQVNGAIEKLQTDNPNLSAALFERYYAPESGNEIAYTAQERAYIQQRKASNDVVRVTVNSGREPVAYFENGEAKGIVAEIAKKVMSRAGLSYVYVDTPPSVDARELLLNKEADVRFDGTSDFNDAEYYGFRVTEPYLQLPLSRVTLKNFRGEPKTVAVIRNSDVVEQYVNSHFEEEQITRYDSASDCLNAVLTGKQDLAFFQTYIAQRLVHSDVRNRLKEQPVPGYWMSFAVAVAEDDPLLFSILNKAVLSLDSTEVEHIVQEQTANMSGDASLAAYLYDHPGLLVAILTVTACFLIFLILYVSRRKNLRLEREKTREFERFISYVCKANDQVIEINPETHTKVFYQVQKGKVCCREQQLEAAEMQVSGFHPQDREQVEWLLQKETLERLVKEGGETYFECRVRSSDEEAYRWFSFTLQGVPQGEESTGSLMIFSKNIDHTKREETQKRQALEDALVSAKQAGEAKGAFMSRMSHEIRTPLNAIIGYLTIARSNLNKPQKADKCLEKSEYAAHHLLSIINNVLDISAIESGKMKIARESVNFRLLISGVTSIFHAQAQEKGVDFRVKLFDLTEEVLITDQLRMNQILMNLLSNAIKFTPAGGKVMLTIQEKARVAGKLYLQMKVSDTGVGMPEKFKKRLFQPFEQQDASTAQKFGGTGLGLSITHNLVMMLGGTIEVETEEGKGTVFTVNLPVDVGEVAAESAAGVFDFSGLRVLAVYDENSDYSYIRTLFGRFGVTYDIVLNREEALRKIADRKEADQEYDLCLLDWDMADVDGRELAEQIREAGTQERPVIVVAAYEDPGLKVDRSLINRVVCKPVFQSSLFDVLSEIGKLYLPEQKCEPKGEVLGLQGVRLLLAEDNEMNMEIATEILGTYGLVIDGAGNGQAAAERFEASAPGTYQAILMDIQMPVLNGYDAARRIRSGHHPQAQSIPIIALTADAFTEDINRALAAGMNSHVSKPVDFDKLCRILSGYLK